MGEIAPLVILGIIALGGELGFFGRVIHQEVTEHKDITTVSYMRADVIAWADGTSTTIEPSDTGGQRTLYRALDGRGRAAVERYTGVPTDLTEVRTTFDIADQPLVVHERRGSGDADARFFYEDPRGLLTRIERGADVVRYGREESGEESYVTSPSGTVSYGYDGLGRLHEVRSGPETTTLTWEAGGNRLLEANDGTRLHECRRYDERGRPRLLRNLDPSTGAGCDGSLTDVPLAEFAYQYDGRGNRLWEDHRDASTSIQERTEYGYDAADRLTGVRYPGGVAQLYRLGGDGSRLGLKDVPGYAGTLAPAGYGSQAGEQAYHYDAQGGLTAITDSVTGAELVGYDLDAAGRVRVATRGEDRSDYTWDARGRLTAATVRKSGTTSSYAFQYDYAGRRIRRTGPEGASGYLWGDEELLEESAPDGGRVLYERGAGMALGVSRFAAGGAVEGRERLMHDGLDSVMGRVGTSGVPALYRYDAWGGFSTGTQPAGSDPLLAYAGQHWDAGLRLSYAQQRWYEPGTGRFLSEDPVAGDPSAPNSLMTFGYAGGNPLTSIDPEGTAHYEIRGNRVVLVPDAVQLLPEPREQCAKDWFTWGGCLYAQLARVRGESEEFDKLIAEGKCAPGFTKGYQACDTRPKEREWHDSDIGQNVRWFWLANEQRACTLGTFMGSVNSFVPVGDVKELDPRLQYCAARGQFVVGGATLAVTVVEQGPRAVKSFQEALEAATAGPALAAVTADGRTVAVAGEELTAAERLRVAKPMEARGRAQGGAGRVPHRAEPRLEDGNLNEGWRHVDARHVTGDHPDGAGDLFRAGTTRADIEAAAKEVVRKGTRISDPARRIQTFERKLTLHGQRDLVRVVVDSDDGNRVITIFPVRGGGP